MTKEFAIGVDLGGTKIYSLVADVDGQVLGDDRRLTLPEDGTDAVVQRIVESARVALEQAGRSMADMVGFGISTPGPCDPERGVITEAPNLFWTDVPLVTLVRAQVGIPTLLENDAAAAAYGELRYGAGQGKRHLVYVTLGTGIGGGIIIDGRIYRGASGAAGEVGHMVLVPDGPRCNCGGRGCLEALSSGTAIERDARLAVDEGRSAKMGELAAGHGLTAELVLEAARQGDKVAREIIEQAGRYLGLGLIGLLNIFNPEALILGGGLIGLGELYLEPALTTTNEGGFDQVLEDVTISTAALGGSKAGALGASALALEHHPR